MCFSAEASFTAAAGLAIVGAATLRLAPSGRSLPFASIPIIFATHQFIEGFIWLEFNSGNQPSDLLTMSYLIIAQFVWPLLLPMATYLIEDDRERRFPFMALLSLGIITCAALAYIHFTEVFSASVLNGHISYSTPEVVEEKLQSYYLLAVAGPLFLSRHRLVQIYGIIIVAAIAIAAAMAYESLPSVWCFFAGISSIIIYGQMRMLSKSSTSRAHPKR